MELQNLQAHIRTLALLEETESPVISCYLNLEDKRLSEQLTHLQQQQPILRATVLPANQPDFDKAFEQINTFVENNLQPDTKGAAIFARAGEQPFFLPLQFRVPLPDWLVINSTPNIYHLIELKDTYHRYIVMISTQESARILEVNLGSVTEELWRERPELRKRVGREWTKEHYQNHRRERTNQFIKEKIKILEKLMAARGHTHLILAGNPQMTARLRNELPRHLTDKLIDTVVAASNDDISDVVAATLSHFIEQEEQESQAMVDLFIREIKTGGLAVAGPAACLEALQWGQADVLILAKNMEGDPLLREALVRQSEQTQCHVEVVNHSDILMEFGGAGCLLRYPLPTAPLKSPAVTE